MLKLDECTISNDQLVSLLNIFSYTKLQRLYLDNWLGESFNFEESPSEEYLENLKASFTKFATSQ